MRKDQVGYKVGIGEREDHTKDRRVKVHEYKYIIYNYVREMRNLLW